jgi:DMSO/TMAO reductase YedYZ heme-binding membrane subunit
MNRTARHALLAGSIAATTVAATAAAPPGADLDRASLTLSWACLLCFAGALLVGPLHALRTGRLQLNHLLRRDLGIWCAVTGLAHLALSFRISMTPDYMQLYVYGAEAWPAPELRRQLYGWAVIGSLVVAALFTLLLLLSNNLALRRLGPVWWKRLQRTSYVAFVLTVAHSVIFQLIESRTAVLVAALVIVTLSVLIAQVRGWSSVRAAARAGR